MKGYDTSSWSRAPSLMELTLWRLSSGAPLDESFKREVEHRVSEFLERLSEESSKLFSYMKLLERASSLLERASSVRELREEILPELLSEVKRALKVSFLELILFSGNRREPVVKLTLNDTEHREKSSRLPYIDYRKLFLYADDSKLREELIVEHICEGFEPPLPILSIPVITSDNTSKNFKNVIGVINVSTDIGLEMKNFTFLRTLAALLALSFVKTLTSQENRRSFVRNLRTTIADLRGAYRVNEASLLLDPINPSETTISELISALRTISKAKYILLTLIKLPMADIDRDVLIYSDLPRGYLLSLKEYLKELRIVSDILKLPPDEDYQFLTTIDNVHPRLKPFWISKGLRNMWMLVSREMSSYRLVVGFYLTSEVSPEMERLLKLSASIVIRNLQVNFMTHLLRRQVEYLEGLHELYMKADVSLSLEDYVKVLSECLLSNLKGVKAIIFIHECCGIFADTDSEFKLFKSKELKKIGDSLRDLMSDTYLLDTSELPFGLIERLQELLSTHKLGEVPLGSKVLKLSTRRGINFLLLLRSQSVEPVGSIQRDVLNLLVKVLETILDKKIVYDELIMSYRRLSELFDNIPHPIILWDPISSSLRFNKASVEVIPNERFRKEIEELIREWENSLTPLERRYGDKTFLVHVHKLPTTKEYLITLTDITQLKRLHEEVMLQSKLVTMGQIVAGVIHELNNPIQAITWYLQIMEERGIPEHLEELFEPIMSSLDRIKRVTRSLLAFARASASEESEPIPLPYFLEETLRLQRDYFSRIGVNLVIEVDDSLSVIRMNPNDFQNIVINLVQNSFDAITDSETGDTIIVRAEKDGKNLILEVEDNGPGIPDEYKNKIFDPLFTTKEPEKGTGLGLALIKRITEKYRGEVTFQSQPGKTVFRVTLPVVSEDLEVELEDE